MGCDGRGPKRERGPSLGIQISRPYSPLGKELASCPKKQCRPLAFFPFHHEGRGGAAPHAHTLEFVTRYREMPHAETAKESETESKRWTGGDSSTAAHDGGEVVTTQGSTTTTLFLPSRRSVSVHVQAARP